MAGSENIDQAGQVGFEAKMQVKSLRVLLLLRVYVVQFVLDFPYAI